uniref:Histone H3 n=1 Tax=Rhizophora mucronata TaxID=61149 RepID=A0A2P2K1E4_RHIMU
MEIATTLVASCFLGAFPPVDLRAVCLVRAICTQKIGKAHYIKIYP